MMSPKLKPRLEMAASLIGNDPAPSLIADIGCDHGRLICWLMHRYPHAKGIATDISLPSLKKTELLAEQEGLSDRIRCVCGDGLKALNGIRPDVLFLCGMGGELIRDILDRAEEPLGGAGTAVLQPMSGTEELREYLYANGYRVISDRIVKESGRYYQVFSVRWDGTRDRLPEGFPGGLFSIGYRSYADRDPLYREYLMFLMSRLKRNLEKAAGCGGEQGLRTQLELLTSADFGDGERNEK
ncbi:MAG: SAM-dependent methyltransferase [Clostridia bacterium]|nr:SAM-dependent methyltransferase [Clostridia bacterium]